MRTPRSGGQNSPSVSSASSSIHQQPPRGSRRTQQQSTPQPPSQHLNHHQRYHFNHLESGMPVNVWGIDRRDVWRTCFCFHVRTVTIFIGVWHLMVYILCLSFIAAMFMYEPSQDGYSNGMMNTARPDPMLPTPVSNTGKQLNEDIIYEIPRSDALTIDQSEHPRARLDAIRNGPFNFVMETRKANSQVVLLTVCNILITLLMVYGAVRGKPSYLMPFFVLRVFDFCIFCLTMVGYFSYLPNVTEGIMNTHWLPFRDFFLNMDPQLLSLLTLVVIVGAIAVKAYIIGVIWNCYKYLMLRNSVIRTVIAYRHDGTDIMGQNLNLLPDLPDYETAVNDPRYAKKPPLESAPATTSNHNSGGNSVPVGASSIAMPPPPPYSVAIAAEPLNFNFNPVPILEDSNTTTTILQDHQIQQSAAAPTSSNEQVGNDVVDVDISSAPVPVSVPAQSPSSAPLNEVPVVSVCQQIDVAPAVPTTDALHHQ